MSAKAPTRGYVRKNCHPKNRLDSFHDRQCTTTEYEFAKYVWVKRGCKNWEDYFKMYPASDVLMLLDIICKENG